MYENNVVVYKNSYNLKSHKVVMLLNVYNYLKAEENKF